MKRVSAVTCLALSLACVHILEAAEVGKLGEKWIYQQEGPRPMSNPPATVEGDRVDEFVAVTGEGEGKRWQIKSVWGKNDETPSIATIDSRLRLHQVEVGSVMTISFTPPTPTDWPDLKVGESTTFETKIAVMGFEVPLQYEVKRLADETITVPAGKFDGCRHIQMVVTGTDPSGQPNRTRYDHWLDSKGHGLIKEIVVSNFQSDTSHRSVSSLKEHIVP
ncbi:MAG: hypothetical protein KJ072_23985 [Verrucomicrobia bacterium]|nr:hypothetical protein [Verrucomicrobiota bacterium]